MPKAIEYIDKISRIQKADVLYLTTSKTRRMRWQEVRQLRKESQTLYTALEEWLEAHDIPYKECAGIANPGCLGCSGGGFHLQISPESEDAWSLQAFLSDDTLCPATACGSIRADLRLITHQEAMQNAHHDEPGFWDEWVDEF